MICYGIATAELDCLACPLTAAAGQGPGVQLLQPEPAGIGRSRQRPVHMGPGKACHTVAVPGAEGAPSGTCAHSPRSRPSGPCKTGPGVEESSGHTSAPQAAAPPQVWSVWHARHGPRPAAALQGGAGAPGTASGGETTFIAWNRKVQHILASCSTNGSTVVWDLKRQKPVIRCGPALCSVPLAHLHVPPAKTHASGWCKIHAADACSVLQPACVVQAGAGAAHARARLHACTTRMHQLHATSMHAETTCLAR